MTLSVLKISHLYPRERQKTLGGFVFDQARALVNRGCKVTVISGEPYWITTRNPFKFIIALYRYWKRFAIQEGEVTGVRHVFVPYVVGSYIKFFLHGVTYRYAVLRGIGLMRDVSKIDVIHAHTSYLDGGAAKAVAKRRKLPYIITEHTGPFSMLTNSWLVKKRTESALKNASRILSVSNALRQDIFNLIPRLKSKTIDILPNCVDVELFRHNNFKDRQCDRGEKIRAIWVGHHVPVKNVPALLRAFSEASEKVCNLELLLVGDGELKAEAENLVDQLGLSQRVIFKGCCDKTDVAKQIGNADFLVISSSCETFGVVAIEAISVGRPVLATACGGPEDVINEKTGLIVENSEVGLRNGLIDMAEKYSCFDSAQLSNIARDNYSSNSIAMELIKIYSEEL